MDGAVGWWVNFVIFLSLSLWRNVWIMPLNLVKIRNLCEFQWWVCHAPWFQEHWLFWNVMKDLLVQLVDLDHGFESRRVLRGQDGPIREIISLCFSSSNVHFEAEVIFGQIKENVCFLKPFNFKLKSYHEMKYLKNLSQEIFSRNHSWNLNFQVRVRKI